MDSPSPVTQCQLPLQLLIRGLLFAPFCSFHFSLFIFGVSFFGPHLLDDHQRRGVQQRRSGLTAGGGGSNLCTLSLERFGQNTYGVCVKVRNLRVPTPPPPPPWWQEQEAGGLETSNPSCWLRGHGGGDVDETQASSRLHVPSVSVGDFTAPAVLCDGYRHRHALSKSVQCPTLQDGQRRAPSTRGTKRNVLLCSTEQDRTFLSAHSSPISPSDSFIAAHCVSQSL